MEASYGFSFQPTRWLGDIAPHLLDPALATALASARTLATERRAVEAAIPPEMRFRNDELPVIPDYGMATVMAGIRTEVARLHGIDLAVNDAAGIIDRTVQIRQRMIDAGKRRHAREARSLNRKPKTTEPQAGNDYLFV